MTRRQVPNTSTADSDQPGTLSFSGTITRSNFELDLDFEVVSGEVLAILGPNGAGKSTLLHALAGLLSVESGSIKIGVRTLDDVADSVFVTADRRPVGFVFQNYRLFPHLTVTDNVSFAARARGLSRTVARASADTWLSRLNLTDLAHVRPANLSGGQQQRVALARALAREPAYLLLDEPFAALDAQTRVVVHSEIRQHLSGFAGPVVLVTHDPLEALLLADRILIIEAGRQVQLGTPGEVTTRPATNYVARLVGLNLYAGSCTGETVDLSRGGVLQAPPGAPQGDVLVALRPSAITVSQTRLTTSSARNEWAATVKGISLLSDRVRLELDGAPSALADVTPAAVAALGLQVGSDVWASVKATELEIYAQPTPAA